MDEVVEKKFVTTRCCGATMQIEVNQVWRIKEDSAAFTPTNQYTYVVYGLPTFLERAIPVLDEDGVCTKVRRDTLIHHYDLVAL